MAALERLAALHGRDHVRWYDLLRIVVTYALWRRTEQERDALLGAVARSNADVVQKREIQEMSDQVGLTIADRALAKGELLGQLRAYRKVLLALLEDRFGPLPAELRQRIEAVDDPELLQKAVQQGWRLQKLEDLSL